MELKQEGIKISIDAIFRATLYTAFILQKKVVAVWLVTLLYVREVF